MNEQCYYRVSVKGIVIDGQGRVLLAREDNGKWELLGGGLDHGEGINECLAREVYEETGLKLIGVSDAPRYVFAFPRPGKDTFIINIVYEITLENLKFTPSEECQELRFFSVEQMQHLDSYGNVQKLAALMIN